MVNQALWRTPTPCLPTAALPEEAGLWNDLDPSPAKYMADWFRAVPPLWCFRTNQPIVSVVPDRIERAVVQF
eukprot:14687287-Alexandrium_andersonii.AAC.1